MHAKENATVTRWVNTLNHILRVLGRRWDPDAHPIPAAGFGTLKCKQTNKSLRFIGLLALQYLAQEIDMSVRKDASRLRSILHKRLPSHHCREGAELGATGSAPSFECLEQETKSTHPPFWGESMKCRRRMYTHVYMRKRSRSASAGRGHQVSFPLLPTT